MSRTVVVTYPVFDADDARTAGLSARPASRSGTSRRSASARPTTCSASWPTRPPGSSAPTRSTARCSPGCPRLRVLARVGVGVDTIDLDAATEAGVAVTTTPGINTNTVADHTLALILACVRRVVENDAERAARRVGPRRPSDRRRARAGSTVGIVGLGAIGRAVAQRVAGFDVRILGYDVADVEAPGRRAGRSSTTSSAARTSSRCTSRSGPGRGC